MTKVDRVWADLPRTAESFQAYWKRTREFWLKHVIKRNANTM